MLLITLERLGPACRFELDGIDISSRIAGVELNVDATATDPLTVVRLTLRDDVYIIGTPGRLELQVKPCEPLSD